MTIGTAIWIALIVALLISVINALGANELDKRSMGFWIALATLATMIIFKILER